MPAESYPRYSRRLRPSNSRWATSSPPTIPTIPHILFRGLPRHPLAEALGPAGQPLLLAPLDGQAVGFDVARNDRSSPDDRALPHAHRRNQRGVRADEGIVANLRPILAEPIVIAGYRPGADIGAGADRGIADIGQVVDL